MTRTIGVRRRVLAAIAVAALAALLGGGYLWLRDSPLVAVKKVTVTGVTGADGPQIRAALVAAARGMTTLDVRVGVLRTAVSGYPAVRNLEVSTQFPHGIRIHVIEERPVGEVAVGGRTIPVAADGRLLSDLPVSSALPQIPLSVPPGGARLSDPRVLQELALLAAAPVALRSKVSEVSTDPAHGLTAQLRGGPAVYFGDSGRLGDKWRAAVAVLEAPASAGAAYIDVTDPGRPAAGAGSSATSAATPAGSATSTTAASASTGG